MFPATGSNPDETSKAAMLAAARAASSLAAAFDGVSDSGEGSGGDARASLPLVAGALAADLGLRLRVLADEDPGAEPRCEAAALCGDLATLAACNASALESPAPAAEVVGVARETIRGLEALIPEDSGVSDFSKRDVLGARWKAELAARQVEDL